MTCPPFFSWNCHEKREGIIITRRRHDRLPLWKRLLVLGLWLPWHLKSQCIYSPRNLFKRKGKPKINLTKRVKKDDLTPLQTFIHVLTQGGNLRLNMSWHLKNDSLYSWFSGVWNWPAHYSLFRWNMSRKTWKNFKKITRKR